MNIYDADQVKAWDAYTIKHEPITSLDLMERAANKCVAWILSRKWQEIPFKIFCGKGNNGGDGLAIARLLLEQGYEVTVYILEFGKLGSDDFQANLQRLHQTPCPIYFIQSTETFPYLVSNDIVIDALFGLGLNKPPDGLAADLIQYINNAKATVIAIDLPSGLFCSQSSIENKVIKATWTLTFQCYKPALLVAENAAFFGEVIVLDILLHPGFLQNNAPFAFLTDEEFIKNIFKKRNEYAHKGNYGHALIIAGSYGKMGAAVLATASCLKTGAGLVTAYVPKCGYDIMQTSLPEAMVLTDDEEQMITQIPSDLEKNSVIGIGPGIGTDESTQNAVIQLINSFSKPIVIDADGLNCLSKNQVHIKDIKPHSVLTPHPKEFDRLFGDFKNDFDRMDAARKKALELGCIIVLKGHHTAIALPDGKCYINATGNAGMAKGGSGDVLTGIITSVLAQNYTPAHAAILGVYLHGLAGDFAAEALSKEAMMASDIVRNLSAAFLKLNR